MHMRWRCRTRRTMAVVHAKQVLGRVQRRNGSNLCDLRSAGCRATLRKAKYIVQPVAEMKIKQLPKGELYWRREIARVTSRLHVNFL